MDLKASLLNRLSQSQGYAGISSPKPACSPSPSVSSPVGIAAQDTSPRAGVVLAPQEQPQAAIIKHQQGKQGGSTGEDTEATLFEDTQEQFQTPDCKAKQQRSPAMQDPILVSPKKDDGVIKSSKSSKDKGKAAAAKAPKAVPKKALAKKPASTPEFSKRPAATAPKSKSKRIDVENEPKEEDGPKEENEEMKKEDLPETELFEDTVPLAVGAVVDNAVEVEELENKDPGSGEGNGNTDGGDDGGGDGGGDIAVDAPSGWQRISKTRQTGNAMGQTWYIYKSPEGKQYPSKKKAMIAGYTGV